MIFCSVAIAATFNLSITILSFLYFVTSLIPLIIIVLLFFSRLNFKLSIRNIKIKQLKNYFGFSFSIQLSSILSALLDPVIKYVIGNFYNVSFISLYEVARRISISISGLFFATFRNYLPKIGELRTLDEYKKYFLTDGITLTKLGLIYSAFVLGFGSIFVSLLIKYWFGYEISILIFLLLALPESINNFGYSIYLFLIGFGKAAYLSLMQLINLVGVSISLLIGFIIFKNVLAFSGYFFTVILVNCLMIYYVNKKLNIGLNKLFKKLSVSRLLILLCIEIIAFIIIYLDYSPFYIVLTISSIFTLSIFYKEFFDYYKYFINILNINFRLSK
jgi:O-antigen/teichoic acid export membrane protein